ncbi:uncharacterized protein [Ptychodera flava]|uniref:uncharacterized protein n=1 Tax=Ptychodera flava TaxID=63121 RepID=UPI00396A6B4B
MKTTERIILLVIVISIASTGVRTLEIKEDSFAITSPDPLRFSSHYYTSFTLSMNVRANYAGDELEGILLFFANDTDIIENDYALLSGSSYAVGPSPDPIPVPQGADGMDVTGFTASMKPDQSQCHLYTFLCVGPESNYDYDCIDVSDMMDCDSTENPACGDGNTASAAGLIVAMATLLASYISGLK